MKFLLGSDIHGSVEGTKFLIKKFKDLKCDKLLLLGDYLGGHYADDQKVIDILNFFKDGIIAIRGNCDRYLPEDIFEFELRDDFLIHLNDRFYLFSHGDNLTFDIDKLLDKSNAYIVHGHTHRVSIRTISSITFINIGSISLPRGGSKECYGILDENGVKIYSTKDELIASI